MIHNDNCDGDHCLLGNGEVRVVPLAGDANLILCENCVTHEMAWRKQRNKELAPDARYDILSWAALKVYEAA